MINNNTYQFLGEGFNFILQNIFTMFEKLSLIFFYIMNYSNDEDELMTTVLLMGAVFAFFAIIIGIALLLIVAAILFLLISGGIISASVLVGFQQKSAGKGFKTFFILLCSLGTSAISVVFFWVLNSVYDWWTTEIAAFAGLVAGVFTGWLLGLLIFYTFRRIVLFLKEKFENRLIREK